MRADCSLSRGTQRQQVEVAVDRGQQIVEIVARCRPSAGRPLPSSAIGAASRGCGGCPSICCVSAMLRLLAGRGVDQHGIGPNETSRRVPLDAGRHQDIDDVARSCRHIAAPPRAGGPRPSRIGQYSSLAGRAADLGVMCRLIVMAGVRSWRVKSPAPQIQASLTSISVPDSSADTSGTGV